MAILLLSLECDPSEKNKNNKIKQTDREPHKMDVGDGGCVMSVCT